MITYSFDLEKKIPLYEQLYFFIKKDIEEGKLNFNDKIPSRRKLADHLKISTVTIDSAYSQLEAEGYIYSKPRCGYFVCNIEKENTDKIKDNEKKSGNVSFFSNLGEITENRQDIWKYDLKTNLMDTESFPFSVWAKLMRRILSEKKDEILRTSDPMGEIELRQEISEHLYNFRGIKADPGQIIVCSGSEYVYTLIIQIIGRNFKYALENPGYIKIKKIFEANKIDVLPLKLDEQGLCVENLEQLGADIIHTTPSHQFPLGMVLPAGRRNALLNWAAQSVERYIIEADYDSEFRLSGRPIPALKSFDNGGRVIYVNTFSRSLIPTLRISYIILPEKLAGVYRKYFNFYSCTVSNIEQLTLAEFLKQGYFERHISRMRKLYRERSSIFINSVNKSTLKETVEIIGKESGLHLLLKVDNGMNEKMLVERAEKEGVRVYGLSEYYSFPEEKEKHRENTLVTGYSGLRSREIKDVVKLLEKAWG